MSDQEQAAKDLSRSIKAKIPVKDLVEQERKRWSEKFEGAVCHEEHTLGGPYTKRTYSKYFDKVSQYLHFISVFGRVLLKNKEDLIKIEAAVHGTIMNAMKAIDRLTQQGNTLIASSEITVPSEWNKSSTVVVPITSPNARLYLNMLKQADQFLQVNSTLWLHGALGDKPEENERLHFNNENSVRRTIGGCTISIMNHHRAIINRLRKQQNEQERLEKLDADLAAANAVLKPEDAAMYGEEITEQVAATPEQETTATEAPKPRASRAKAKPEPEAAVEPAVAAANG